MGLTVRLAVAYPDFADELPAIVTALADHEQPGYTETSRALADVVADSPNPAVRDGDWPSFPYTFLHYLRRIAVHLRIDPDWHPTEIDDPDDDDTYRDFSQDHFDTETLEGSHLYCHSDSDGFYVPVDFETVIWGDGVPFVFLGSSQRLLAELAAVGRALGFDWGERKPSPEELQRAFAESDDGMPFYREKYVFASMYEVARLSVAFGTAIVFS